MAAYIEQHPGSLPTVKQHMAAIRMLFSSLTEKGVLAMNPAREVKTQKFSRLEGQTPAPPHQEVQRLLESIDVNHLVGLRDRALLAVMAYTLARIGAVVSLAPQDYMQVGKRSRPSSETSYLPKNRAKLQDNHNVSNDCVCGRTQVYEDRYK
jgi:integrase/recombinase XerD